MSVTQRVVLITGASRGIGAACALRFAKDGYACVINYLLSKDRATEVVASIEAQGGTAFAVRADVADSTEASTMIGEVVGRFGRLDVLVNNAGVLRGGLLMLMDEADLDAVIAANLKGVFNCSKAAVRQMISQRSGAIVNISSMSGITGLAGQTDYSASKGGVIAFTRALAKELAQFNIRVNAVAPGLIDTDMACEIPENVRQRFLDMIPLKRLGRADEVAGIVRFLASSEASYITGETVAVSGGIP
ncbi:MAG: 3-oxoacyl-ACP reductase FabG [Deltaproteobacteria bacterium]|nr:3-oxoacyl-ACP reductase FabG [Deltaproteobacteria bacterium]